MNSITILASDFYLPSKEISNDYFNKKFNIDENWIEKRTGIKKDFFLEAVFAKWLINLVRILQKMKKT